MANDTPILPSPACAGGLRWGLAGSFYSRAFMSTSGPITDGS
jgi:hypothetical protein